MEDKTISNKQINTYRFYFISGLFLDVEYSNERVEEMMRLLSNNWNALSVNEDFGMNFSMVTHYERLE